MIRNLPTPALALWTGRGMSALFALFMLFDAGIKLMRMQIVEDSMVQLGYPRTVILGAVLFTGVLYQGS